MNTRAFPHRLYLSAAVALASGGFAVTAGIISGEMHGLLDTYIYGYRIAVMAVVGISAYSLLMEDDDS
jgi:hypothetical protein